MCFWFFKSIMSAWWENSVSVPLGISSQDRVQRHHVGSLKSVMVAILTPLLQIKGPPIATLKAVLKYLPAAHHCRTWQENPAVSSTVPEENHRALHVGTSADSEWSVSAGPTALLCNLTAFPWSVFPSMPLMLSFSDPVHFPPTSNPPPPSSFTLRRQLRFLLHGENSSNLLAPNP